MDRDSSGHSETTARAMRTETTAFEDESMDRPKVKENSPNKQMLHWGNKSRILGFSNRPAFDLVEPLLIGNNRISYDKKAAVMLLFS